MQRIHKLEELMSFQKQALKEEGLQLDCSGRPPWSRAALASSARMRGEAVGKGQRKLIRES